MSHIFNDTEMQAIPIEDFLRRPEVAVNSYLRLGANRFVLVARAGAATAETRLANYRAKSAECVFVRLPDYKKLVIASIPLLAERVRTTELAIESRLQIIEHAVQAVYSEAFQLGFLNEVFVQAQLINHAMLTHFTTADEPYRLFEEIRGEGVNALEHAMLTSLVSVMIGRASGISVRADLEALSLGGFLHDFGNAKLPVKAKAKDIMKLTPEEKIIFASHPIVGQQLLAETPYVTGDVLAIIGQHHERVDGSGFPRGLRERQIHPLAQIVALANAFVDEVAEEARPLTPRVAQQIVAGFIALRVRQFSGEALRGLEQSLSRSALGLRLRIL